MTEPVAFVYPAAKHTLLVFFGVTPVVLEKVEQQAPTVKQLASSVQIAPSAIAPVVVDYGVYAA